LERLGLAPLRRLAGFCTRLAGLRGELLQEVLVLDTPAIVPADVAFMLVATALVLLMTPALAFFYGGLVRSKNALNT
jgi:Amt family ammonium transporter